MPLQNGTLTRWILGVLATLTAAAVGTFFLAFGGMANNKDVEKVAVDLDKQKAKCADRSERIRQDVGDIKIQVGSIDTSLRILVKDYIKTATENGQ